MTVPGRTADSTIEFTARIPTAEGKLGGVYFIIAAAALGAATAVSFGELHPLAIKWLTVAIAAGTIGALRGAKKRFRNPMVSRRACPAIRCLPEHRDRQEGIATAYTDSEITKKPSLLNPLLILLIAGLTLQIFQCFTLSPTAGPFTIHQARLFDAGLIVATVCLAVALFSRRLRWPAWAALLAIYATLGVMILTSFSSPGADVFIFGRGASTALLHGHNPYAVVFPNIYNHSAKSAAFYGAGSSAQDWLQYGYPYPPMSLLAELPGALAGDFRYAHLLAVVVAAAFIATCRKDSPVALGAAGLLLFTPRGFFVIEAGWIEPIAVMLLAATVWSALRHPRWLAIPLGLLLVSKQYMIFAVPATWLLVPIIPAGKRVRVGIETVLIGAAASVPLAIIGGKRFWQSVVVWQFHQPFRTDSLSYPAMLAKAYPVWSAAHHVAQLAPVAAFMLAAAMLAVCLWRLPRTPAGFAATVGMTLAVFFAFNKQAFCNYYFFVIASFCIVIAASNAIEPPRGQDAGE